MSRKPFTLRIENAEHSALKHLSKIEGRSINQLLNDAVRFYLSRKTEKERGWEATLEGLKKYRKLKGKEDKAIAEFVEGELTTEDPLEGEVLEGDFVNGQFKRVGPVQRRVRKLLSA